MGNWVSLNWNTGHTKIQITEELGIELEILKSGGKDLTNGANHAHPGLQEWLLTPEFFF